MASYLITGTARGLGYAMVSHLASLPAAQIGLIIATSRSESSALTELVSKSSGRVVFVHLDTTNEASVKNAVLEVDKILGSNGLDVLINNAGIMGGFTPKGVADMEDLSAVFATNVTSVHSVTRSFLPLLRKGHTKKIANISTTLGSLALAGAYKTSPVPAYKISKAALNMLTVQYAQDYADEGFIIFSISPGWLKTDLGGKDIADLPVETGAAATLDKILGATKEDNGAFKNIGPIDGWEKPRGMNNNFYDGVNSAW